MTHKIAKIVVKENSEVSVLRALLPNEILDVCDLYVADERSALASVARTLLVKDRMPVAAVIDTKSLDPGVIWETVTTMKQLLEAAAAGTSYTVIYCVPELESIFFDDRIDLKKIFPKYDQQFFLMFAKTSPKQALEFLFKEGGGPKRLSELLDALTTEDTKKLRETYPIGQLMTFI